MSQPPVPPLPPLLAALTFATGMIDAVSVLGLGNVFTANMTGNVVFLGFAAAGAGPFHPGPLAAALAAFLGGAIAGGRIGRGCAAWPLRRWLGMAAGMEVLLVWGAAALAVAGPEAAPVAMILCLGAAMGLRNATVRSLAVPDMTTTVLTLTLTGIASESRLAGGTGRSLARRVLAVAAMFAGAFAGAALLRAAGPGAALALAGAVTAAAVLAVLPHPGMAAPRR
ncbi:YoaK family protein [Mangrovicoccus sp. HB161399]|uniref:YoaK family protein n=1 Tax=Mangrovicoccus sp. HB161399 TaxID=2720392 RepID=UPI00155540EA|nr:YoaK family protein [Mangrovicoccus sp. HB161399]